MEISDVHFRGKDIMTGDWVYGFYTLKNNKPVIISNSTESIHYIKPKTLGMYSGVPDVDGKPIYSGDIVESFSLYVDYVQRGNYPPPNIEVEEWCIERSVHIVDFDCGSFCINGFPIMFDAFVNESDEDYIDHRALQRFKEIFEDSDNKLKKKHPYLTYNHMRQPRIIGNIFDNPKLSKVEHKKYF